MRFLGRFGDPDVEGDVTGWRLLGFLPDEDRKEEEEGADVRGSGES